MQEIPLTNSECVTVVDDDDYALAMGWCWYLAKCGLYEYVTATTRTSLRLHRLVMRAPRGTLVDHIDGDTLRNLKSNLRLTTQSQNQQNRAGPTRASRTGIRGVTWDASRGKYKVQVQVQGKNINVGRYATIEEAEQAAIQARSTYMTHSER